MDRTSEAIIAIIIFIIAYGILWYYIPNSPQTVNVIAGGIGIIIAYVLYKNGFYNNMTQQQVDTAFYFNPFFN